jgi:hypothetical protein
MPPDTRIEMGVDRTLLLFREIRDELKSINRRMDHEFSEIRDRLQRVDERIDGFIIRVEKLEEAK